MSVEKLVEHFSTLEYPRCAGKVEHRLIDILVIASPERAGMILPSTVATRWAGVPEIGQRHSLARHLPARLHADRPGCLRGLLHRLGAIFAEAFEREVVAINGKTLRRSFDHGRTAQISMRARRKQAAWNDEYILSLLAG
jgi:hypothetical protein